MTATEKATVFRDLLSRGDAQLMFDARRPGVVVPPEMIGNACMRLVFSLKRQIKNFVIDDVKGVSAVFMFQDLSTQIVEEIAVSIPWDAVFGLINDKNQLAVVGEVPPDVTLTLDRKVEPGADAILRPTGPAAPGEKRIEIDLGRLRQNRPH